jgi:hypothetical protein
MRCAFGDHYFKVLVNLSASDKRELEVGRRPANDILAVTKHSANDYKWFQISTGV